MSPRAVNSFHPRGRVAFDVETTGLDPWKGARIFLAGMEDEDGNVLIAEPGTMAWMAISYILQNPAIEKVGWNIKFDLLMSKEQGLQVGGKFHDAMLMTYMNNEYEPNLKLKDCARRHLKEPGTEEKVVKSIISGLRRRGLKDANYSHVPRQLMKKYLEKDLDDTIRMMWKMEAVIKGGQSRVYEIEREVIPNAMEIERWGIHVDKAYCKKAIAANKIRIAELEGKLAGVAGCKFNYNSPDQLSRIMESLGMHTGKRGKDKKDGSEGPMKTGVEYMRPFLKHPLVSTLMELRSLNKITGTYFESFLEHETDGLIHPNFWPFGSDEHGIKTGRFSSSDPNFQNIPGGGRGHNVEMLRDPGLVRRAVTPRHGYVFLFGDYKQIEFIIFACHAGDQGLLKDIRNGVDLHTANAWRIFGKHCFDGLDKVAAKRLRFEAKELNFAFIFGMGVARYALRSGLSIGEARARKNKYFMEVPAAREFLLHAQSDLLRDGYVQDQFGRRYHVPKDLCYKAANVLCQGPAALVMKRGINRVFNNLRGLDAHPFITVHDELGVEVRRDQVWQAKEALVEGMEDRENFPVPIKVEVSVTNRSWADKKEWTEAVEQERWLQSLRSKSVAVLR